MTHRKTPGLTGRIRKRLLKLLGLSVAREPTPAEASVAEPETLQGWMADATRNGGGHPQTPLPAGTLQSNARPVREVMRPRTSVVAFPLSATEGEVHEVVRRARHSSYPVYAASLDDIVGVFMTSDLRVQEPGTPFSLARTLREPVFVPDTRPAPRVLDDLRKTHAPMAVVLDEVGGTAGIVTLKDLLGPEAGDISDEYRVGTGAAIEGEGAPGRDGRRRAASGVRRTAEPGRDGAR